MQISIVVNTTFEGFHRWLKAPDSVGFLRDLHRHIFHVTAYKRVSHADRDTEFILLKRQLDGVIQDTLRTQQVDEWSCEHWAIHLAESMGFFRVYVSEDGENGAQVEL